MESLKVQRHNLSCSHTPPAITILGDYFQGGSYLLRIDVCEAVALPFGRFKQGKILTIPAGTCLYVGSAMNGLAKRLIRHATRTAGKPPHNIRAPMLEYFGEIGLGHVGSRPLGSKLLHWHVDHLLDRAEAHLVHIYVLRSSERLESDLFEFLDGDPHTFIIIEGLGASDSPGSTHILGVNTGEAWWRVLPQRLESRFYGNV